jgi:hypothetical protein
MRGALHVQSWMFHVGPICRECTTTAATTADAPAATSNLLNSARAYTLADRQLLRRTTPKRSAATANYAANLPK